MAGENGQLLGNYSKEAWYDQDMSNIKWNEVTWYSKLGAIILFILVVPVLTFYIGRQYEAVVELNKLVQISDANVVVGMQSGANVSASVKSPDLIVFIDQEAGYRISFPQTWKMVSQKPTELVFNLPTSTVPSTVAGISATTTTVEEIKVTASVRSGACIPTVDGVLTKRIESIGGVDFTHAYGSDAAMSHAYFEDEFYTERNNSCYILSYASVVVNPGVYGLDQTQSEAVSARNDKVLKTASAEFAAMVLSFSFVDTPAGQNEAETVR